MSSRPLEADEHCRRVCARETQGLGPAAAFPPTSAVCARTGLPLAWQIETARAHEFGGFESLLDKVQARGFMAATCALDKGYDYDTTHELCAARNCLPVTPLRMTSDVLQNPYAGECEHGVWRFGGADFKNKRTKWRCPTGECKPAGKWVKVSRRTHSSLVTPAAGASSTEAAQPSSASSVA
jgi:hypothetical protein